MKNNNKKSNIYFSSIVSIVITLAFVIYNLYLSIVFFNGFAIGISIYYALLILVRTASLIIESRIKEKDAKEQNRIRLKNYKISSALVFVIDFCLIAPIILMVTRPQAVAFGTIPAITMAAFCVYKVTVAIVNYTKSKKTKNLTIILFKLLDIIGAIVSILTLQHTLIMVFGSMDRTMTILSFSTSIGFIALIVLISILSYYKNRNLIK